MPNWTRWATTIFLLAATVASAGCGEQSGDETGTDTSLDITITDIGFGNADVVAFDSDAGVDDAAEDAMSADVDPADTAEPNACPGGAGCVCTEGDGCDSAYCIDVAEGKRCAAPCVDACEPGFSCAPVSSGGGDVSTICVPKNLRLCDPCKDSKDCKSLGIKDAACVDQGSDGAFCGTGCKSDEQCLEGYHCKAVTTIEGASANMCVPKPADDKATWGTCACSKTATDAKLATACFVEHHSDDGQLVGKCPGLRTCGEDGLSACTAPPLEVEICDGKDNDCDGKIDEGTCDDGKDCTQGACDPAQGCLVTKLDGVACDADGDVCTENDTCSKGVCLHGKPKNCDDGNACTIASCDLAKGCTQTGDEGKPCDADDDACTVGDICKNAACLTGKAQSCDDSNPCTSDACDKVSGKCKSTPVVDGVSCDDGTACTTGDGCKAGTCTGKQLPCDDGNACTANTCDPNTGCKTSALNGASCDDDNPCTIGDKCAANSCKPGSAKACAAGGPCVLAQCKLSTGKCSYVDLSNGDPCNDGSACTANDACKSGVCLGKLLNCNDSNPCTSDTCDKATGCKHANIVQACDDGDACTTGDICGNGKCNGQAVVVSKHCDDGKLCTTDACNSKVGCTHSNNQIKCDDGSPCTAGDACLGGKCNPGADLCECKVDGDCAAKEDGNLCNGTLFCDKVKLPYVCKVKTLTVVKCDTSGDGPCLKTGCNTKTGKCNGAAINEGGGCDADGSVCSQSDACAAGVCKAGKALDCDDKNPCTNDLCHKKNGCYKVANSKSCDDGDACTKGDVCDQSKCAGKPLNVAVACNDNNGCTDDACDPVKGCTHSNNKNKCDDGEVCTNGDFCAAGQCVAGTDLCDCKSNSDCAKKEDGNLCNGTLYCNKSKAPYLCKVNPQTVIICNGNGDGPCEKTACAPKSGKCLKEAANEGGKCDADGSVCTQNDACTKGKCQPGKTLKCADGNVCTNDICDKKKGCFAINNSASCNDGNACTKGDHCSSGQCASSPVTCNDSNPCTTDLCDKSTGCKFVPNIGGCNDGNACTKNDKCGNGKCTGSAVTCNDGNVCTDDFCDKSSGCKAIPNGAKCNDGNACTKSDHCGGGKCGGSKVTCNDGKLCTNDSCHTSKGCQASPNTVPCNDGNACTAGDKCSNYKCVGSGITCNDNNPCTKDTCNTSKGCQASALPNNTPCPGGKVCQSGKCTGVAVHAQCKQSYTSINDSSRKYTNSNGASCDSGLATKWYRYVGNTGTKIPEFAPPKNRCGTHAPGWMNGKHPSVAEGVVTRKVCYHWSSSTCYWSNSILVVNCNTHYLYRLTKPPVCHLRYCSQ